MERFGDLLLQESSDMVTLSELLEVPDYSKLFTEYLHATRLIFPSEENERLLSDDYMESAMMRIKVFVKVAKTNVLDVFRLDIDVLEYLCSKKCTRAFLSSRLNEMKDAAELHMKRYVSDLANGSDIGAETIAKLKVDISERMSDLISKLNDEDFLVSLSLDEVQF